MDLSAIPPNPWGDSMAAAMGPLLGDDALGRSTLKLLQASLETRTYQTYGSTIKMFLQFCAEEGLDPLDLTPVQAARYVAWLGHRGTVAAGSLQPYLSAINKLLQDHGRPPVALGPLVAAARKGLKNRQSSLRPKDARLPLPAPVALSILEHAERLVPDLTWDNSSGLQLESLYRAMVAVLVNYIFFCRGETGVACQTGDLVTDTQHLTLFVRQAKGHHSDPQHQRPVLQIERQRSLRLTALVENYNVGRARLFVSQQLPVPRHQWQLCSDEQPLSWSAATVTQWLESALSATGNSPPPGFTWTSHSLRSGPASAANAIGVVLTKITFCGGWAKNSSAVHDYIDPTMQPTPAAHLLLGHLLSPHLPL